MTNARTLTLAAVKSRFDEWRANKKRGEHIPAQLWTLAQPLVGPYKISAICRDLRISTAQYNRYILLKILPKLVKQETKGFVGIPLNALNLSATPTLCIARGDGITLTIQHVSLDQLGVLVNTFLETSSCYK